MTTEQIRSGQDLSIFNPRNLPDTRLITRPQPTIFVDRDGVINQNRPDHVLNWKDFQFVDGSLKALALLHQADYQVIVVTNQAAIARGLCSLDDLELIHHFMQKTIEESGGKVHRVLYCTHLPTAGCECRKPKPGLLFRAAQDFNIDLASSWLIGDHSTDMQAAIAAGCKPLLVLTGRGKATYENCLLKQPSASPAIEITGLGAATPLTVKANLLEAAEFILGLEKNNFSLYQF